MFRGRNILTKSQWMGIAALIMAMVMVLDPVLTMAEEGGSDEEIVIFSSDGTEIEFEGSNSYEDLSGGTESHGSIETGSDSDEESAADIMDEDEIWALVDYDELRSYIDVDVLRGSIDEPALLDSIDKDALRAEIDGKALLAEMEEIDLEDEFVERKLEGESFVIDENGQAIVIEEEDAGAIEEDNIQDPNAEGDAEKVEEAVEEASDAITEDEGNAEAETESETDFETPVSLAEIISEETRILEDGTEVKNFKVKYMREMVEDHPVDVINTQLPVIGDRSPFDFVIDPMKLLYQTVDTGDGRIKVEENASVLFKNTKGEYDFSHKSDMLKFVNKSNVPVKLTITANIKNPESVPLVSSTSELEGNKPGLFMALADDVGVAAVVTNYGDAVIETVLKPVPDGTYVFEYNEETGKYSYTMVEEEEPTDEATGEQPDAEETSEESTEEVVKVETDSAETLEGADGDTEPIENPEETADSEESEPEEDSRFDSYSFGVVAACNTEADWSGVKSRPVIGFTWNIEPILTDWENVNENLEADMRAYLLENREEYEAFKMVKAAELVEEKLIDLLLVKLEELKEAELERLIHEEVLRLACEQISEMSDGNIDFVFNDADGEIKDDDINDENTENNIENTDNNGESSDDSVIIDGEETRTGDEVIFEDDATEGNTSGAETVIIFDDPFPQADKPPTSERIEFFDSLDD